MKNNFMNKNNRETFKVEWNDPKNAGLDLDQGIDYDERLHRSWGRATASHRR